MSPDKFMFRPLGITPVIDGHKKALHVSDDLEGIIFINRLSDLLAMRERKQVSGFFNKRVTISVEIVTLLFFIRSIFTQACVMPE